MTVETLYRRYLAAQVARDRPGALRVVFDDGLDSGVSVPELYLDVIQPAQYQIGRLWQTNRISVAEEHIATGISHLALSLLYPSIPRSASNGSSAIVACVGGERHDLGARMVADFYEMAGFSVRYVGADVDPDRLVAIVNEDPPDLLALSVTMTFNVEALRRTADRARSAVGDRMRMAVGGSAVTGSPGLSSSVGADVSDPDVRSAVLETVALLETKAT